MPTLHEIRQEMQGASTVSSADATRRKYLEKLSEFTGRPTVVYAGSFTVKPVPGASLQINRHDVQSFMSALVGLSGKSLDLILHSPGGSAEATEQIINYLRGKFNDIRVIVPQNAMSAATMLSCAANRIVMGRHSALGPIDPQLTLNGGATVAAQSILDEFQLAQSSINQPGTNPLLWVNKVRQHPPGLLSECHKQIELSKKLVGDWLEEYMFAGQSDGESKAQAIAKWLGNNKNFLTHGRAIGIALAQEKGLVVDPLEEDQKLQEAVLSVFHATIATFQTTNCCKLVENQHGKGSFVMANPK